MPRVKLIVSHMGGALTGDYDFDVAPRVGEAVAIKHDERAIYFVIEDAWHVADADRHVRFFAVAVIDDSAGERTAFSVIDGGLS